MESMLNAIRFTVRTLVKSPGFLVVAVMSIALGTSATTTVFSWIQALLLNPLPGVKDGNRLVTLETVTSGDYIDTSYPDFRDFRDRSKLLSGIAVFKDVKLAMGEGERSQWVSTEIVSGNFFDVLGVRPKLGRFFTPEEQKDVFDTYAVAIISNRLWEHAFHSDPSIIGKTTKFNGYPFAIVGVAPDEFKGSIGGAFFDAWLPSTMLKELTGDTWLTIRAARPFHAIARLGPGVNISMANQEITNIAHQLEQEDPKDNKGISAVLLPVWKAPYGAQNILRTLLGVLMGVAIVVLLIVCSNVANLLLIRAVAQEREICTRLALGARRRMIVQQLLLESLILALLGTACGILLTFVMKDALRFLIPQTDKPLVLSSSIDGTVLVFSVVLAIVTATLFGLAPALKATNVNLSETLNQGGRGGSSGKSRLRETFVVSSVAFGLVATIGAGLFVQSFRNAQRTNIGFDPDHVLLVGLDVSQNRLSPEQGIAFYNRLREDIKAMPGVRAVSYANDVPLGFGGGSWDEISVEGYQPQQGESMKIYRNIVSPGYFDLMKIPLLQGRDFTDADDGKSNVMIVNQTFVKRYFGQSTALGRVVQVWGQPVTVIGVVKDLKYKSLQEPSQPYMYYSLRESYRQGMALHIRTDGDPSAILPAVERKIKDVDPNISVFIALTLEQYVGASFYAQKLAAVLLSILGGVGLLLAVLGVYGVTAYSVNQQKREFGIRMALGAQRHHIVEKVLLQGLVLAAAGIAFGIVSALALSNVASSLLFGISSTNVGTLILASLVLTLAVLAACFMPSWRATRIDPSRALRYE
jgi:putative ABC transport system permease protein